MEAEARILEQIAGVATITKVLARPACPPAGPEGSASSPAAQDLLLQVHCSQRNLAANAMRKFALHGVLPAGSARAVMGLPLELPDALLVCPSPSGRHQVVFKAGGDAAALVLQVWSGSRLQTELLVSKTLHGPLVNDGYFASGAAWSPDETAVAYTAEQAPEARTPAWGGPESLKDAAGTKSWRGVGPANEDWGELNTGKRSPAVFVLDIPASAVIKASAGVAPLTSVGQPQWAPGGSGLVAVAWPEQSPNFPAMGRKLGVVFCFNRPAHLLHLPLARGQAAGGAGSLGALAVAGPVTELTKRLGSALSPCFTPDGAALLYLSHDVAVSTGTHSATAQLYRLPWHEAVSGAEPLVPGVVVGVPPNLDAEGSGPGPTRPFPGLYASQIAEQPFLDPDTLLLTSQFYSQSAILAVDLRSGAARPITPTAPPAEAPAAQSTPSPSPPGSSAGTAAADAGPASSGSYSWSLVGVVAGRVLALRVGTDSPSQLFVATPPPPQAADGGAAVWDWQPVSDSAPAVPELVQPMLANVATHVMRVAPGTDTQGAPGHEFETVVFKPREHTGPLPTILAPHGGPHTGVTTGWYPPYAFLAQLGYAVLCPNYRGSTGFGQAPLQSLPGLAGRQDVDDCMASLQAAVDAGISDPDRVAVVGGSHGGFLSGHLIGQFPDAFKMAVMRNPVCNISLMVGCTDITDWCFVEVLGCEAGMARCAPVASPDDLAAMYAASPVAHLQHVKAPVMLMLGAKDRRVPQVDGLQYHAALRAQGVDVRLLVFPEDTHALDKPQTEFEQWLNVAWMAKTHLGSKQGPEA